MGQNSPTLWGLPDTLLHCGISAPSDDGFMSEMGHKHRISVLLSQPLCRKCLQYLPNFVRRSEASHVPDSYVERQKGLGWVELAGRLVPQNHF